MGFFLFLVSLLFIVEGVLLILTPKKVLKFANQLLDKTKDARILGLVPLIVGIMLLFAASSSAVGWLIVLLGLGAIAKAVYVFLTPVAKIKASRWYHMSDNAYRVSGIIVLVLGVIVFISRI
ncbi:MAG: DUF2065 family protein [Candidatus Omnitrophica bacterium]|nr:DUF2065 family protein [Candidatus Omnitrophota bacterium]MDD5573814.1 DUF2065 family protein [Candidatus Omnitrophota bacterium]